MNLSGEFTAAATPQALTGLLSDAGRLEGVGGLSSVSVSGADTLDCIFSPVTSLGRIPLRTTITTLSAAPDAAALRVVGVRGHQAVDADIALEFAPADSGTTVRWTADVVVRGGAASVGQRVWSELASRAIGDVLAAAASVA